MLNSAREFWPRSIVVVPMGEIEGERQGYRTKQSTAPSTIGTSAPLQSLAGYLRAPGTCIAAVAVAFSDCSTAAAAENCSRDPDSSGSPHPV